MVKIYTATIEYRDEYTRGRWSTHSCSSSDREQAIRMVLLHCSDCEHRNLVVSEQG